MAYSDHFKLADDMISHLDTVIPGITAPLIISKYAGFVAVSAVTVYELAIKEIFCTFADQKHIVFGVYAQSHFDRINGRIKIEMIRDDYIKRFGKKYLDRFKKKLDEVEVQVLRRDRVSVKASYSNIIEWRNQFAHEGVMPAVTYQEVVKSYKVGKEVIDCLYCTMRR